MFVLATGCGSGEQDTERSAAGFSEGLTQATASFRARTAEIKTDGRAALQASDQAKVLAVYQSLLTATQDAAERYHALTPPDSVKAEYAALLETVDGQVDALSAVVSAANDKDSKQVADALRRYAAVLVEYATELAKLGGAGGSDEVRS